MTKQRLATCLVESDRDSGLLYRLEIDVRGVLARCDYPDSDSIPGCLDAADAKLAQAGYTREGRDWTYNRIQNRFEVYVNHATLPDPIHTTDNWYIRDIALGAGELARSYARTVSTRQAGVLSANDRVP